MFNLVTLVNALQKIGSAFPSVNTVVLSDIYKLNDNPSIDYSVFAIVQDQHRQTDDYFYFNFYLYYVDRLLNDKSNQLEIQSHGINLLSTVISKVEELGLIINTENYRTYQSFNQRFSDECAGVFARVEIQVPVDCTTPFDVLVDPLLANITITSGGTYSPSQYGADGFKEVTVETEFPDIWVKKVPTMLECEVGKPVDMNDITTSGYYFIYAHNIQISNFVNFGGGWCPNILVDVIKTEFFDEATQKMQPAIVQVATTNLADNEYYGGYWPRRWYRICGWNAVTHDNGWSEWQEIATNENAVMQEIKTLRGTSANTIDFNNVTKTGFYFIRGLWTDYVVNGPYEHIGEGILEVYDKYDAHGMQRFTEINSQNNQVRTYVRYKGWNGWTDWYEYTLTPVNNQ